MIIFKTKEGLKNYLRKNKFMERTIGFVPTMGALHNGHISLIKNSLKYNNLTICSLFVNPTQFNNKKDFELYPTPLEKDILKLLAVGCDILFLPTVQEMYPRGEQLKTYELGAIENILEGEYRPGHYQGVCQIVAKLLETVTPDNLYLGQKDYQQCMVIKKLISIQQYPVKVNICKTIREESGLAMSSRNIRLSTAEKKRATLIYETLLQIKKSIQPGELAELKNNMINKLAKNKFKVDYVAFADAENLLPVVNWNGKQKLVALIAATLNEVRLIDNMPLN